ESLDTEFNNINFSSEKINSHAKLSIEAPPYEPPSSKYLRKKQPKKIATITAPPPEPEKKENISNYNAKEKESEPEDDLHYGVVQTGRKIKICNDNDW